MRDLESSFGDTSGVESLVTGAIPSHYFSAGARNLIVLQTRAIVSGWTGVGHRWSSPWRNQLVGWGARSLELILRPLGGTEGFYPVLHCRASGMGGVHFVFSVLSCPASKGQLFLSPSWIWKQVCDPPSWQGFLLDGCAVEGLKV